ncbi:MAG: Ig-like domain-containing protein [Lachnospiraceae bacterium]|nr:Ig-like domain-containing protein [Lachnospiraceae bacterium]
MNKKRTKQFISILLAGILLLVQPASTFAYIGAICPNNPEQVKYGNFVSGGAKYTYMENEYLHFDICIDDTKPEMSGTVAHTIPMVTLDKTYKNIDNAGRQVFKMETAPMSMDSVGQFQPGKYSKLSVMSAKVRTGNIHDTITTDWDTSGKSVDTFEMSADMAVDYYFIDHDEYVLTNYFKFVKLNEGNTGNGETVDIANTAVMYDENDETENWGVSCVGIFRNLSEVEESVLDENKPYGIFFRQNMDFEKFPAMGHDTIKESDYPNIAVNAQYYSPSCEISYMNISNGVAQTPDDAVWEVYSDSYAFASPFVATSGYYAYHAPYNEFADGYGVEGHHEAYPIAVSYAKNTLTTVGRAGNDPAYRLKRNDGKKDFIHECDALWGFRNLKEPKEEEGTTTNPDAFKIQGDAPYLCVFENGDKKGADGKQAHVVIPADTEDDIKRFEEKYGTCVAKYQGNYFSEVIKGETVYSFRDGSAAISPTIVASWSNPVVSGLKLHEDGTLDIDQSRVSLNAPTFKFYEPKEGGGLSFDSYDKTKGLALKIDPSKNNSYINIDIPGNGVSVKGVSLDTSGNLVFTGKFKINLFLAQMDMKKLGYGLNGKSEFVCNGVHAEGMLKVPKIPGKDKGEGEEKDASPSVLGFGGAKMHGEVNTFKGEEKYAFEFTMNIKSLFSTQAELELVRLKNGRLCPEHLYFEFKGEKPGMGVDIPPGTPVVTITGGGGGIDGLASTIDGNYVAIPPVVLTLVAYGEIVKVVDGKLTVKVGPSQLRLIGEDVGFKVGDESLKLIDSMYAGVYLNGKEVTYTSKDELIGTRTYRGVAFGGEMGLGIKIFNYSDEDIENETNSMKKASKMFAKDFNGTIRAKVALSAETCVANAVDDPQFCYVYLGSTGSAHASLCVPEAVPLFGGKSLAGAGLDYKIGAQTAFQTGNGTASASAFFRNLSLSGGIAATGSFIGCYGRVIYLFPQNEIKTQGSAFHELGEVNWDELLNTQTGDYDEEEIASLLLGDPVAVTTEDGQQALMMVEANIAPLAIEEIAAENDDKGTSFSHTINVDDPQSIADGENAVLIVVPTDQTNMTKEKIDAFAQSLTCNAPTLNLATSEAALDEGNYNGYAGTLETDDDGNVTKRAVFVSLTKEEAVNANASGITFNADSDFRIVGLQSTPATNLAVVKKTESSGDYLDIQVTDPEENKEYCLYTYLGTEKEVEDENGNIQKQIGTDYMVDSRTLDAKALSGPIKVSLAGLDLAPSGEYYQTVTLVEKKKVTVTNEDGTEEEIETEVPVTTWQSAAASEYENKLELAAPEDVDLTLLGNESVRGSWSEVAHADGYKVTIYQETEEGGVKSYVDTGRGFTYNTEDFTGTEDTLPMQGLSYDETSHTFSLDTTLTANGEKILTDEDGKEVSAETAGESVTPNGDQDDAVIELTPGKNYKIGVSAFKKCEVTTDGETSEYEKFGSEKQSDSKLLPEYKPVDFKVSAIEGWNDGWWHEATTELSQDATGTYSHTFKGEEGRTLDIQMSGLKDKDGHDVSADTTFKVTRLDAVDDQGNPAEIPMASSSDPEKPNTFSISDFEGSASLEVKALYNHDGVTDETIRYVNLNKDNTAPVVTLDQEVTYTENDGTFNLTGITEPGSKVTMLYTNPENPEEELKVTDISVDAEGAFTVTGKLENGEASRISSIIATDPVGNDSQRASTVVTRNENFEHTIVFEDGFGNVLSTQSVLHGKDAVAPAAPSKEGLAFDGWDREFKNVQANMVIKALWKDDQSAKPVTEPEKKKEKPNPNPAPQPQKDDPKPEAAVKVSKINITGISKKIAAGKKIQLTAEVLPENAADKNVTWESSNPKVATVDANGLVKIGKKAGGKKVTITATAADGSGIKADYKITVMKKAVKKLKLSGKKSVKAGRKLKLKAKVTAPKGANTKLKWESSNPAIATVNSKGLVKANKKAKGKKVTITVMTTDGTNLKKKLKIKIK